ncbi:MAG: MarR family transcriptional regulator [Gemmatimonadales bacterium]|nr:MAG: MarR family transcriptional regulator [Gemmatimonadales bacterium]
MAKQKSLRPHDVSVLLQLAIQPNSTFRELASRVSLSLGETHNAAKRLELAGLFRMDERALSLPETLEFLVSGVPYAFPPQVGAPARGIPTALAALPLLGDFPSGPVVVWADRRGGSRGDTLVPLSPAVGDIWERNHQLYSLLTVVDALRVGRPKERERAREHLELVLTSLRIQQEAPSAVSD